MNISVLADAVEAVIGAIYIDGGYKPSLKFIDKFWGQYLDIQISKFQDSKTKLQEMSQQIYRRLPVYKLLKKEGPSHSPIFTVSLKVFDLKKLQASGTSIREAEKNAASLALIKLNEAKSS